MDNQPNDETPDKAASGKSSSFNEVIAVLDRPIRREIVQYLAGGTEQEVDLDELVNYLSGKNLHTSQLSSGDRIALRLHHVHLPKLAETGVIDYDPNERRVSFHGETSLDRCLDLLQEDG